MKSHIAGAFVIVLALGGCDKSDTPPTQPNLPMKPRAAQPANASAPAAQPGGAAATASLPLGENGMPVLARDEDLNCVGCHMIDSRLIGPPWREVSARYKGATTYKYSPNGSKDASAKEYPLAEGLVIKVSKGGHGNWGTMPMPANDPNGVKKDRIEKLIQFILTLSK